MHIALATSVALTSSDQRLVSSLQALGCTAQAVIWSDPKVDWQRFDTVVVRSCWDYHARVHEFVAWAHRLQEIGVRLMNPAHVIAWNSSKEYLLYMAQSGVVVPATALVDIGSSIEEIALAIESAGSAVVVIKPAISHSAINTWLMNAPGSTADLERIHAMATQGRVLVQAFIDDVRTAGETSIVFIDGAYSHAVIKHPAAGDFRVQFEHGGRLEVIQPSGAVIAAARRILLCAPGPAVYARVDGVVVNGVFTLMELELIEPELYLDLVDGSSDRFAASVIRSTLI